MLNNNLNLKEEVLEILENIADNDYTMEMVISDVLNHGCVSGIVSDLIYYYQTEAFFNRHKQEINEMVQALSEDLYGDIYELYHNFNGGCSKNTLAWFAMEEMTRIIADEMNIEY